MTNTTVDATDKRAESKDRKPAGGTGRLGWIGRRGGRIGPDDRVATVLWRAFATIIGLAVLVGVVGVVSQILVVRSYEHVLGVINPARRANIDALQTMTDAETAVRGYIISNDRAFLGNYRGAGLRAMEHLDTVVGELDDPALNEAVTRQRAALNVWFKSYGLPAGNRQPVNSVQGEELFDQFRVFNHDVEERMIELRAQAGTEIARDLAISYVAMGLSIVVAVVVGAVVGRRATRQLVAPLRRTQQALDAIADGDLTARARVHGPAEIQAVAESVSRLAEQLALHRSTEESRRTRDEAVRTVVHAVQTGVGVDDVLALAVSSLGSAVGIDRAIYLPVADGRVGEVTKSWSAPGITPLTPPPIGFEARFIYQPDPDRGGAAAFAVADVAPLLPQLDADLLEAFEVNKTKSFMSSQVFTGSEVRGLLALNSVREQVAWSDEDKAVLENVAREVGVALARAEVYQRQREMLDQLVELDRERDVFVYTVSHELRTPLTSIVGYLEMVEDEDVGPLNDEQQEMIGKVTRNAVRLQGLVSDLLSLAKIQSGTFEVDLVSGTLGPVVDGAWDAIQPAADAGGLELRRETGADDVELQVDPVQTDRMLVNLLSNAVKFTPAGGSVTLTTTHEGDEVVLAVADTGIGVPAEEQSKLFTRFFRASTARDGAIPGTGLGLSLVAAIVHKHGGRVSLTSEPGQGTTVRVRLPAASRPPDAEPAADG